MDHTPPTVELPRVCASTDHIQQIVFNLLTNSFAHTRPGDSVTVRVVPTPASDPVLDGRPGVALVIEDTGEGMDEETLQRIYEPFFTRGGRRVGHGLGMPIVRRIVEENEGVIEIQSTPGKGSRFRVVFPALTERSTEVP
jgi:signal transduction histidine kinase